MLVTIHQPNFLPWLGFFDKIRQADVFVILDNVPFTKGGYQNRVGIKGPNGRQWLTVPVITAGRLGQSTNEVEIQNNNDWRKVHLKTLTTAYGGSRHYESVMAGLSRIYESEASKLADFCVVGIRWIMDVLGITTPVVYASSLAGSEHGSALLCEIAKATGADAYLSGPSGRAYLDVRLFEDAGVSVSYHELPEFSYAQRFGPFVWGLSTIDYLFNEGARPWWS